MLVFAPVSHRTREMTWHNGLPRVRFSEAKSETCRCRREKSPGVVGDVEPTSYPS